LGTKDTPFIRKLGAFGTLTDAELVIVSALQTKRKRFSQGRDLVLQGQTDQPAYVLSVGWVCSYKLLADGSRQILDFQIPGDFLGIRSVLLKTADYSVVPITPIEAAEVTSGDLVTIFTQTPRLAMALLWAASRDEAMLVEHLVGVGRRSAVERTAHLLLELGVRLRLVGLGSTAGYDCPLSQYLLADALGLSAVHVNRVLRFLREEGLLTFQRGRVTIHDFEALAERYSFSADYLEQGRASEASVQASA
jgi:CRP-like cAMP-binding protein